MPDKVPAPWQAFLVDADRALRNPVEVHCLGGFVLAVLWALPRPTADVDFIEVGPSGVGRDLLTVAGEGSEISLRHGLYFHRVTIAEVPEGYVSRLVEIAPRRFTNLRLRALEVHDLVLAKLGRNSARDRADVEFLVRKGAIDRRLLEERFEAELRPYVLNEERHREAFQLWTQEFF
jgi:hypothetical protein